MKVLELFAGTRSIGKAFEAKGHQVFSIEWDESFDGIDMYEDVLKVTSNQIIELFGHPDVIWASPDCSTYSVAAISHHRRKNELTGNLDPITEYAIFCDKVNQHVLELIKELHPKYWFIENPRGGAADNVLDARTTQVHRYILPIWRRTDEAYRYMDESSSTEV